MPGDAANHYYPGPWRFYVHRHGFQHVISDRDGRYIVSGVPVGCGPLLAAGPQLLDALERIASVAEPQSPVHSLAVEPLESFREREGMVLADWRPNQPAPRLRVVGTVT